MKIYTFFISVLKETYRTALTIFKIMIPVSVGVKILEYTGMLDLLGEALSPLMKLVGLPGATGVVWASAMLSNIYGGMIAFASIQGGISLTTAQVTVLSLIMLVAHTFPIELQVAYRAGVRLPVIFVIRFGFALLGGMILNAIYTTFSWGQSKSTFNWMPKEESLTLDTWLWAELERYGYVVISIFCLLLVMRVLKISGLLDLLSKALAPILGLLGISQAVIPMAVIGLTTGLLYGGALIIKETEEKEIPKLDIFYAMLMMGLCHALVEDSLLMISLGADFLGVVIFRIAFAVLITFLVVRMIKKINTPIAEKILTRITPKI